MVIMTMNSGIASMNVHAANMHARMFASSLPSPAGRETQPKMVYDESMHVHVLQQCQP
jgi:hypothetical protein